MAREARDAWAKRVERLADSGLTAKEYAAEIGVNANTLAGWRWRLRSGRAETAAGKPDESVGGPVARDAAEVETGSRRDAAAASSATTLQSVTPMRFVELTAAPVARGVLFEIVLRSGVTVRVPSGFDAGELVRLVDVLGGPRS